MQDAPLDLRMNPSVGVSAAEWLETVSYEELSWVMKQYGPDSMDALHCDRVAQVILDEQKARGPYKSMRRLAEVIGTFVEKAARIDGKFEHTQLGLDHPAKLYIQSIRLFLNSELEQLRAGLQASFEVVEMGGRVVISVFKKKEEKIIQSFVQDFEDPDPEMVKTIKTKRRLGELYPLARTEFEWSVLQRQKPIRPTYHEIDRNRRGRSGVMYVLEKAPRTCPRVKAKPRKDEKRFVEPKREPLF
eukprot:TRINITY_DN3170_c0_g1_i5.p1 TRINITY_DN3170_c0_g1~~TRINITY_DN3170_c0_g1_i5.p1  ORF type:complete len:245 (+),score=33.96 TRINITY_DN3170_c0_g1_i5:306-1040(+)